MATKIFVNLPVKNLSASIGFFTAIGFTFNPQFTDDKAACMIIGEDIFVMLIAEQFFRTFTKKTIADAGKTTEAIIALSAESRKAVSELVEKAMQAGAKKSIDPQDHGFMYQESFEDPDGHLWEILFMDLAALPSSS